MRRILTTILLLAAITTQAQYTQHIQDVGNAASWYDQKGMVRFMKDVYFKNFTVLDSCAGLGITRDSGKLYIYNRCAGTIAYVDSNMFATVTRLKDSMNIMRGLLASATPDSNVYSTVKRLRDSITSLENRIYAKGYMVYTDTLSTIATEYKRIRDSLIAAVHITNTSNPHSVTLQQAATLGNTITSDIYTGRQFFDSLKGNGVYGNYNTKKFFIEGNSIEFGSLLPDTSYRYTYLATKELGYIEVNQAYSGQKLQGNTSIVSNIPVYDSSIHAGIYFGFGVTDAHGNETTPGTYDTASYAASFHSDIDSVHNQKGWPYGKIIIGIQNYTKVPAYAPATKYAQCNRDIANYYGIPICDMYDKTFYAFGIGGLKDLSTHPYIAEHAYMATLLSGVMKNGVRNDNQQLAVPHVTELDTLKLRNLKNAVGKVLGVLVQDEEGNVVKLGLGDFMTTDSTRHQIMGKFNVNQVIDTTASFTVNNGNAPSTPFPQLQSAIGITSTNKPMLTNKNSWNSSNTGILEQNYVARTSSATATDTVSIKNNDTLSLTSTYTWNGSNFANTALMLLKASGDHTTSNLGSTFDLRATKKGATSPTTIISSDSNGYTYIPGNLELYDGGTVTGLNVTSGNRRVNQFTENNTNIWQIGDWNAGANNGFNYDIGRGTKASPTAIQAGDAFRTEAFNGYDGVGYSSGASLTVYAPYTWSNTGINHSVAWDWKMTSYLTNTPRIRMSYDWLTETIYFMQSGQSATGRLSLGDSIFIETPFPYSSGTKYYPVLNHSNNNQLLYLTAIPVADVTNGVDVTKYISTETPSGSVNGTNTTFTLANAPVSGTVIVFLNGLRQKSGAGNDYTISGNTITYLSAPLSGDVLTVSYISQ